MRTTIRDIRVISTAPEGINLVVVKVETSEPGLYGLGCASFTFRHLAVQTVVEQYLKLLLVGMDVANIEQIWQIVHHNAYWRNGPIANNALSGVDMALWDIKGKMAKMPLYDLFGGKCREGVPVYRHADGRDATELCENIARYREQGIGVIRVQLGGYGGSFGPAPPSAPVGSPAGVYLDSAQYMRTIVRLLEKVRATVGFEVELCHDVHERLRPVDVIRLAQDLEPIRLFFLEDALPVEQGEWFRQLRHKTNIPLAQGELFNNPAEWRYLIVERLIDFVRVHISQIGGITPARKLQLFAEQFAVRTAWHGPGDVSPVGHAANIHIDLASQNLGIQEWSGTEPPNFIIQDIKGPRDALLDVFPGLPEFRNGYVYPNDKPGLGIEINEAQARKYPCAKDVVTWTRTRQRDGTVQEP